MGVISMSEISISGQGISLTTKFTSLDVKMHSIKSGSSYNEEDMKTMDDSDSDSDNKGDNSDAHTKEKKTELFDSDIGSEDEDFN
jgi:hypothetical protein